MGADQNIAGCWSYIEPEQDDIALFAGLALHSARAAIVTSFLLVLLTQANIGSFTMADSAVFPAVLTGISLLCALLSLRGAETRDLM